MKKIKSAAIYARSATTKQTHKISSTSAQIKVCQMYAKNNNFKVEKIYQDVGESRMSLKRPQFKEMLQDVKKKNFKTIIVRDIDRLSRSQNDLKSILNSFKKNNVKLICVTDNPSMCFEKF